MFFAGTFIYAHAELYYEIGWWKFQDNRDSGKAIDDGETKGAKAKEKKKNGKYKPKNKKKK